MREKSSSPLSVMNVITLNRCQRGKNTLECFVEKKQSKTYNHFFFSLSHEMKNKEQIILSKISACLFLLERFTVTL